MNPIQKLLFMLSFYNMIWAYSYPFLKDRMPMPIFWDVVRANAFLILVVVMLYHLSHGQYGAKEFYDSLFHVSMPWWAAWLLDVFVHVVPLLVVGLPHTTWSMAIAYITIVLWYLLLRGNFANIYGEDTRYIVCWLLPLGLLITVAYTGFKLLQ